MAAFAGTVSAEDTQPVCNGEDQSTIFGVQENGPANSRSLPAGHLDQSRDSFGRGMSGLN